MELAQRSEANADEPSVVSREGPRWRLRPSTAAESRVMGRKPITRPFKVRKLKLSTEKGSKKGEGQGGEERRGEKGAEVAK